ncbi:SRPBCC family protein [Nocardioides bruguierae]|uniref:SRPBCC family protein n=1 Tax=Nocardioides bruguierae TaxID=2945102 RepID=A0A9X2D837_9ACTN|nr:SRPBCC family protein [Nocardioides bruguierae]MCM0620900.1 SRPBCC family protein [Nocardioides bruguierae]
MSTAPVLRSISVPASPARAFEVFTEQIGAWWPIATHGLFGGECGWVGFEDGLLVERALDGRSTTWGEVLAWTPGQLLAFSWHPGREADDASEVEVRFLADGDGTRVELEHRGWERFGEQADERRRTYVGPGAWGFVLEHFADVADGPAAPVPGLAELEAAYETFFAAALAGPFGPAPAEGEWDAASTVAHVTLNDQAMIAVANALVHQREARFENVVSQDPAVLAAHVARFADLDALVAHGRAVATLACVAAARLDPAQRETAVHCRLLHDGEVVLDQPMPWGAVALDTQASRHLPAHVQQLENLRTDR